MGYPYVREAEPQDYEAIWKIWMQPHVIQWMSFEKTDTKELFMKSYLAMQAASTIYVLVDKVNDEEKIVAVRRIKFGKDEHRHIAEYCSMGVDAESQGRGYGRFFYKAFLEIVRDYSKKNGHDISRIQLTQSGGNMAAFHLADKDFFEEALFPDWLERLGIEGNYYLIERYIYCFLDKEFAAMAATLPSLKYEERLPDLQQKEDNPDLIIKREGNRFIGYFQGEPLLTVDLEPDNSVIKHIGFLDVKLHTQDYQAEAVSGLRDILKTIMEEGRVKKVELFTADSTVTDLCKQAGFYVRGEKMASYCKDGEYKNELGVEYSFFGIADAKRLILAQVSGNQQALVNAALSQCTNTINCLIADNRCDTLGASYLENLAYQMVRDELGPNRIFSLTDKRWEPLLAQTPENYYKDLLRLKSRLQKSEPTFFNNETREMPTPLTSNDNKHEPFSNE